MLGLVALGETVCQPHPCDANLSQPEKPYSLKVCPRESVESMCSIRVNRLIGASM